MFALFVGVILDGLISLIHLQLFMTCLHFWPTSNSHILLHCWACSLLFISLNILLCLLQFSLHILLCTCLNLWEPVSFLTHLLACLSSFNATAHWFTSHSSSAVLLQTKLTTSPKL
jgi:hypothetical protein